MRGTVAIMLLLVALVGGVAYAVVGPNVPKCSCHLEWIGGSLYWVCC